jgi:Leucine-rich repeat (LRR) protein
MLTGIMRKQKTEDLYPLSRGIPKEHFAEYLEYVRTEHPSAVDLSRQDLEEIPEGLLGYKGLECLNVSYNKLRKLPDDISVEGATDKFLYLDAGHNLLEAVPEKPWWHCMHGLYLDHNRFTEVPLALRKMLNMDYIYMQGNSIAEKPRFFNTRIFLEEPRIPDHMNALEDMLHQCQYDRADLPIMAARHADPLAKFFGVTPLQAILFTHICVCSTGNHGIDIHAIGHFLGRDNVDSLGLLDDVKALEKLQLVHCHIDEKRLYSVSMDTQEKIGENKPFKPEKMTGLKIDELFVRIDKIFDRRVDDNIMKFLDFQRELLHLIKGNTHLAFCDRVLNCGLDKKREDDFTMLLSFFHLYVNEEEDAVSFYNLDRIFSKKFYHKGALKSGTHPTQKLGFVENTNSSGFVDREYYTLTRKAKKHFLSELNLTERITSSSKNIIKPDDLEEKSLYYNAKEEKLIDRLTELLQVEPFKAVGERLAARGMRKGFACLFYGPPGTGKTETVYQIARRTGRDILMVNIAEVKSMWYGESEKQIKDLFEKYHDLVDAGGTLPILLFNEADAIIGKRKELSAKGNSIEQTENTIQNIILQEMETLEGIMIATTNLMVNLDRAFERRFLYKIRFEKPGLNVRQSIWRSIIPELSPSDAASLADRFDFTGGQIENIARKRLVDEIVSGGKPGLEAIAELCKEETLYHEDGGKIVGFRP